MTVEDLLASDREYVRLTKKASKLSLARFDLPAGSSRARVTTANARWMRAAEARDLRERQLRAAFEAAR